MALPELMTINELREYLHIGICTAYEIVHKKDFPSLKVGKQWFIIKEKLPEWVEKQTRKLVK